MHIHDIFAKGSPTLSFEIFPPHNGEGTERLNDALIQLEKFSPDFVSVTYGAGGSTRNLTQDLVLRLQRETSYHPLPHLTCVAQREQDIDEILEAYAQAGISNLLALRGDPPRGSSMHDHSGDAFPHAVDLIRHIRRFNDQRRHADPRGFGIGVAAFPEGHPGTPNRLQEMDHLKKKVDAGADYLCTQLFFHNNDFHDFRDRCELAGIRVPIIAGILPVTTLSGLRRICDLAGGARVPARLQKALQRAGNNPEAIRRVGSHHATEQCVDLLDNDVAGLHFYTLNQTHPVHDICTNLSLSQRPPSDLINRNISVPCGCLA